MENRYIAAIDLGTSKIVGAVGSKNEDGHLVILAIEKEDAGSCMKRGCILNVEEAAAKVKKIITKLENRIPDKIARIYVGIGGQSLHTIDHSVGRQLNEDTQITEKLIQSIISEGQNVPVYNSEILEIVPTDYKVDNRLESQPIGIFCTDIVANLKLILGRPSLKKNIYRCLVERLKMPVAGYLISPLATAAATLTDNEKKLGCALVDFGAGTTTLSIYKDSFLRYIVTIPFGGKNITRDICSLNLLESDAESLKIAYGSAVSDTEQENKNARQFNMEGVDSSKIKYQTLCRVVEARIEEIVENVINQIELSGYGKQLSAGIIITGGASQLKALPQLLKEKTEMEIRKGGFMNVSFANKSDAVFNPEYVQVIGLLLLGDESCMKEREVVVTDPEKPKEVKSKEPAKPAKGKFGSGLWGDIKKKMEDILIEEKDSEFK